MLNNIVKINNCTNRYRLQASCNIEYLSPIEISLFHELITRYGGFTAIYPSQETLAKRLGVSRVYINRILKQLEERGLITKTFREWTSCVYTITQEGRDQVKRFNALWKFFKWLPLTLLVVAPKPVHQPEFTQDSYKDLNLFKNHTTVILNTTTNQRLRVNEAINAYARERRASMKQITPELQQATSLLKLTKWGQITLSAYPTQALTYACTAYKANKTQKTDEFKWFMGVCNKWCKDKNVEPAWNVVKSLSIEHKSPSIPRYLNPQTEDDKPFEQEKKQESQQPKYSKNLVALERAKMRQKQKDWEAQQDPQQLLRKQLEYAPHLREYIIASNPHVAGRLDAIISLSRVTQSQPVLDSQSSTERRQLVDTWNEDSDWEEIF